MPVSVKKLKSTFANPAESAKMVNLVYVNDMQEGITRIKRGKNFRTNIKIKK